MPGRSGRDEMQNVRTFGAPVGTQAPVNASDRPKVGPVSDAALHSRMANSPLFQKPIGSQASTPVHPATPAVRPTAAPVSGPSPTDPSNPTRDLSLGTAAQRITSRPAVINQAVDDATR